jgi:hypothetical protein
MDFVGTSWHRGGLGDEVSPDIPSVRLKSPLLLIFLSLLSNFSALTPTISRLETPHSCVGATP